MQNQCFRSSQCGPGAIKRGNFETWTGHTYSNVSKYLPRSVETMRLHMVQSSQGVRSSKNKTTSPLNIPWEMLKDAPGKEDLEDISSPIKTNELHIWDKLIRKLYTDDCDRFPIWSRSRNEYIIITYHCDSNTILQATFDNGKNKHRIWAFSLIMKCLDNCGHTFDNKILDNEVIAEFEWVILENWGAN